MLHQIIQSILGTYTFRDYEEVNDVETQCKISSIILQSLGNNTTHNIDPDYELGERNNCLPGETKVRMIDGSYKRIDSLKIGSFTSFGKVQGIYKCVTHSMDWYEVNNTIVSPRLICSSDFQDWNKAYNIGTLSKKNFNYGYHLILNSRRFELENKVIVRDFIETDDELIQDFISNIVSSHLNNNYNTLVESR